MFVTRQTVFPSLLVLWLALSSWMVGATPAALHAQVNLVDDSVILESEASFDLPKVVSDAINKGVAVTFLTRAKLFRWQWWYFDEQLAVRDRAVEIVYQPVFSSYRVRIDGVSLTVHSLDDALAVAKSTGPMKIYSRKQLKAGGRYYASVAFALDLSKLPRPMQVSVQDDQRWAIQQELSDLVFRIAPN